MPREHSPSPSSLDEAPPALPETADTSAASREEASPDQTTWSREKSAIAPSQLEAGQLGRLCGAVPYE